MKIITCTLPNANACINGVKFTAHQEAMVSEPVEDALASGFAAIPGYTVADAPEPQAEVPAKKSGK